MLAKLYSAAILGIDAYIVEVEVDIQQGLEKFHIVGLPDKAVQESKERVTSAIKNSIAEFVHRRITVNLAPANVQKSGAGYDLPIALGILISSGQLEMDTQKSLFVGELSLEGYTRHIDGIIVIADAAKRAGFKNLYIPYSNLCEGLSVSGLNIFGVKNVNEIVTNVLEPTSTLELSAMDLRETTYPFDFGHVHGQETAKRVMEIAASGQHNVLLFGTPGSGKSLMAKAFPSILPELEYDEQIEVTRIYSVAGKLSPDTQLIHTRPFRSPHHTSSEVSLVGGGKNPMPGEVTLAHRGVLFLDEFPEFSSRSLEALRQPIEDGYVNISRASGTLTFPSRFILLAAMNPCKCGWRGDPERECRCSNIEVAKYLSKVSGPIVDRFDMQLFVPRVKTADLANENVSPTLSAQIRLKVQESIEFGRNFSREIKDKRVLQSMLTVDSKALLISAVDNLKMSARGYFRIINVARTIANMSKSESIQSDHVSEAISYRMFGDFK
jgi:magnesium chelatase family protein